MIIRWQGTAYDDRQRPYGSRRYKTRLHAVCWAHRHGGGEVKRVRRAGPPEIPTWGWVVELVEIVVKA